MRKISENSLVNTIKNELLCATIGGDIKTITKYKGATIPILHVEFYNGQIFGITILEMGRKKNEK